MELEGKVAIVTGGASGMGLATVRRFLEAGAKVIIADVQDEPGARLEAEFGDAARYHHTDVAKESDVEAAVDRAVAEFGGLHVMFNNAGFGGVSAAELEDLEIGEFYRYTIDVLFTGVLSGIKHASRVMKPAGGGSIISTASVAGLRGGWGPHVYSAMKSAVINLTKSTALELGPAGIRVNAICPGFIATAIFAGQNNMSWDQRMEFIAELEKSDVSAAPIQRAGKGVDIANMALFLGSDASTFITGQAFVVDGGLTAGTRRQPPPDGVGRFQAIAQRIQEGDGAE